MATIRTARKQHDCYAHRFNTRTGRFPILCDGVIAPGEQYIEQYDGGDDPFHPLRYHIVCAIQHGEVTQ